MSSPAYSIYNTEELERALAVCALEPLSHLFRVIFILGVSRGIG